MHNSKDSVTKFNNEKHEILNSTIAAMVYLINECKKNQSDTTVNILQRALADITIDLCGDTKRNTKEENIQFYEELLSPSLFAALEFLSKYASIDDREIKKEIISKLEKYMKYH